MKRVPKWLRHPLWLTAVILFVWYKSFGYKYGFIYNHGISMQPTIGDGDWVIMQKRSTLGEGWTPDRYDVVVIQLRIDQLLLAPDTAAIGPRGAHIAPVEQGHPLVWSAPF